MCLTFKNKKRKEVAISWRLSQPRQILTRCHRSQALQLPKATRWSLNQPPCLARILTSQLLLRGQILPSHRKSMLMIISQQMLHSAKFRLPRASLRFHLTQLPQRSLWLRTMPSRSQTRQRCRLRRWLRSSLRHSMQCCSLIWAHYQARLSSTRFSPCPSLHTWGSRKSRWRHQRARKTTGWARASSLRTDACLKEKSLTRTIKEWRMRMKILTTISWRLSFLRTPLSRARISWSTWPLALTCRLSLPILALI